MSPYYFEKVKTNFRTGTTVNIGITADERAMVDMWAKGSGAQVAVSGSAITILGGATRRDVEALKEILKRDHAQDGVGFLS